MTRTDRTDTHIVERSVSLDDLANKKRWVAWREETRRRADGSTHRTKIPLDPSRNGQAQIPTNPATWATRERAETAWRKRYDDGRRGGVGLVLGELEDGTLLMGLDLDGCVDPETKKIKSWAAEVLDRFHTYAEVSPSGKGIKAFYLVAAEDIDEAKGLLERKTRKQFSVDSHCEIAVDRARYYTVTDDWLDEWPKTLRTVSLADVRWLIERAGPSFLEQHGVRSSNAERSSGSSHDESGSGYGYRFMLKHKAAAHSFREACKAILADRGKAGEWARRSDKRQLKRAWENHDASYNIESLNVVRVADVKMERTRWVWARRLARGKLTIIAGDPGLGKSQIATDIAARISKKNGKLPDGGHAPTGSVIILSAEDAVGDTIRPRLEAAGANTRYIHAVGMIKNDEGKKRAFDLRTDLDKLEEFIKKIREHDDVVLVIIDPISAYLGDVDSHKMTLVRPALATIADFAEDNTVAVLAIHHPPKEATKKAIHAFSGSLAFSAAPRLVFIVTEDQMPGRYLLLAVKSNLGPMADGLSYQIVDAWVDDDRIKTSVIEWDDEPVTMTANEALRAASTAEPSKVEQAQDFLHERLADGPLDTTELIEAGAAEGFSERTLREAKKRCGVKSGRSGGLAGKGSWQWWLP